MDLRAGGSHYDSVKTYFDSAAGSYQVSSCRWPWSRIREGESRAVFEMLEGVSEKTVLELGCGAGYYTNLLISANAKSVVAVDISPEMCDQLPKKRVTPVVANSESLRLGKVFDVVLSTGMLEFAADPLAVFETARLHIDHEGKMIILVPAATSLGKLYRLFHAFHGIKIRLFSLPGILSLAAETGWRVERTRMQWPFSLVCILTPKKGENANSIHR